MNAIYIEVSAAVRYWEDATVNGQEDTDGKLIPLTKGSYWVPIIRLADGQIMNWPKGTTADVHYKVCDQGEYWLRDEDKRIAKWIGFYVPNDFLCHGDQGYGDYIIFKVDEAGLIQGWKVPTVDPDEWEYPARLARRRPRLPAPPRNLPHLSRGRSQPQPPAARHTGPPLLPMESRWTWLWSRMPWIICGACRWWPPVSAGTAGCLTRSWTR